MSRVGIVGLGLIGGSLARDLADAGVDVCAYDTNTAALRTAIDEGVVGGVLDPMGERLSEADMLVIATPLPAAIELLRSAATRLHSISAVTDVCSTKGTITRAARELALPNFVGSHPLAGDHRGGWQASRRGLFRNATVYVCPGSSANASRAVAAMWRLTGAVIETIEPDPHDALLAWTSHLPQCASTALVHALRAAGVDIDRLGPGGRDMTRLAQSPADIWTATALDNAAVLVPALDRLGAQLRDLQDALAARDEAAVQRFFQPVVTGGTSPGH